jgi:RNA polymerase sigma-70 factor (ECF subfamily)
VTEADFRDIYREHGDAVYRFAWRMTGSVEAAEDATQDCFAALWRSPHRYTEQRGSMRAFLVGIARNVILKKWRKDQRWSSLEEEAFTAEPLDAQRLEAADLVGRAVGSLPPLQREVLILFEYEGMTLEEIARTVAVDVGAVKARLHRARQNLRQMLACLRNSTCNL